MSQPCHRLTSKPCYRLASKGTSIVHHFSHYRGRIARKKCRQKCTLVAIVRLPDGFNQLKPFLPAFIGINYYFFFSLLAPPAWRILDWLHGKAPWCKLRWDESKKRDVPVSHPLWPPPATIVQVLEETRSAADFSQRAWSKKRCTMGIPLAMSQASE